MRVLWILCVSFIGLELLLFFLTHSPKSASSLTSSPPATTSTAIRPALNQPPEYETYTLDRAIVHTVLISAQSQYQVIPAVTPGIATLKDFAEPYQAIAVINGGFFDPANQQSTSYVTLQGRIAADPQQNDRLTNNPDLAPYLDKIFNRSEFRQYQCGQAGSQTLRHDIALHKDAPPAGCQLVNALGAGPRLLPDLNLQPESFLETAADGSILRDPIDHNRLSPRSAIGITADGSVILVMAAQKPGLPDGSGLTLQELANFMKSLGVQKALNLDGGGSASLYFDGTTHYGKLDEAGNPIERPVKSVLLVK